MAGFNCNDCVKFGTEACRFGVNHRDYSEYCDDMLVEQDHAYGKGKSDEYSRIIGFLKWNRYCIVDNNGDYYTIEEIVEQLKGAGE